MNAERPTATVAAAPSAARQGERSTGFGTTLFDGLAEPPPARVPTTAFDVCHVGVVLRTLVFAEALMAIGLLFGSGGATAWLTRVAAGSGLVLPGVLLWLVTNCALKRSLAAAPLPLQWLAACGLGAVCGVVPAAVALRLGPELIGESPLLGAAAAGAMLGGVVFTWLRLRGLATLPADTTARLAELQSRIRPHFLFNTLNTALALVRVDPARAEGVLEDLAELFRVALTDIGQSVSLADEVELARRYLAIEQVRFGSRLTITWDLDDGAAEARVPPLILQPLVENAVRHGVEPSDTGGTIRIRTGVRMGRALVMISNSVPQAPSRPGNGMALQNVRERLRLMHDMAAQFETRREDGVFRVQMAVPL